MKKKNTEKTIPFLADLSAERFEAVIHSISDGVFTVDRDWRITCFNRAAEEITGIPRSEALGRRCYEVLRSNICKDACALHDKEIMGISPDALNVLMTYDYPGNVRELSNIIEHGCVLSQGSLIQLKDLPSWLHPATENLKIPSTLQDAERQFIVAVLRKNNWNRLAAARELGIHKTTLFRKIKRLGINLPSQNGRSSKTS